MFGYDGSSTSTSGEMLGTLYTFGAQGVAITTVGGSGGSAGGGSPAGFFGPKGLPGILAINGQNYP